MPLASPRTQHVHFLASRLANAGSRIAKHLHRARSTLLTASIARLTRRSIPRQLASMGHGKNKAASTTWKRRGKTGRRRRSSERPRSSRDPFACCPACALPHSCAVVRIVTCALDSSMAVPSHGVFVVCNAMRAMTSVCRARGMWSFSILSGVYLCIVSLPELPKNNLRGSRVSPHQVE